MRYFLGIDGGGTKTTALLCDENLTTVATACGDSINYNSVGTETARNNLKKLIDILAEKSGYVKIDACFIGLSALSYAAGSGLTESFCNGIIHCPLIAMDSDVYIGLEAMLEDGPSAMVIAGTGSMTAGRLENGTIIHKGGWGYILGDEGSGYTVSVEALKAGIRGYEGSGKQTSLTGAVCDFYNVTSCDELIDVFYDPPMERSRIASFASEVFKCAAQGDETAITIIARQAEQLADTVCALLSEMPHNTPVGLWGGLFQYHNEYTELFTDFVKVKFPDAEIKLIEYSPEYGAVFASMKLAGLNPQEIIQGGMA